jgi:hypothetical protein
MPVETVPTNPPTNYFLVAYGDDLTERTENEGKLTDSILERLRTDAQGDRAIRHVFILSHGWRADVPAARRHYEGWIRLMVDNRPADAQGESFIIGLHWPSEPFGDENFEPRLLGAAQESLDHFAQFYANKLSHENQEKLADVIRHLVQTHPIDARQLGAARDDVNMVARFEQMIGLEAGSLDRFKQCVQRLWETQKQFAGELEAIGNDLNKWYVRMASFWKMKQRAFDFGSSSAAELLTAIIATAHPNVRIHLVGHSFGSH